ncbi:EmrB/QacA subfamily drug resistance transporter [Blastococcus colisei]|uniref:EmrB/QacA subfamily drug resistance transporter n=1 Tax=Blastococcus colisei TaxID=1564162 RepID=A0A543PIN3_9ACTN|nr:MFS transporter [Blastococcus colisei]TQN43946.1 EmrB/QacA subfamily drug resistance transporter [Blastococcus colisei]
MRTRRPDIPDPRLPADEPSSSAAAPPAAEARTGPGGHPLWVALVLISTVQLMVVLDGSVVNIALPRIQDELAITDADLTWVVTAYAIAFGGLLLLGGRLGDVIGRRKVFFAGVLLFSVGSLLAGLAQEQWQLLAARALQGGGAAAASPTALALITTTFPAGPPRNRAFAVYAAMSGAGAAVGLILGGALTEASWRWTMLINVPIGLAVAVLAPRFLAESEPQPGRWDLPGALTATLGLAAVVYGFNRKAQTDADTGLPQEWSDTLVYGPVVAGVLLLVAFFVIEARSPHALLPMRVIADRTRAVSFAVMLVTGAAIFAMFLFVSLFVQQVLGYSPLEAGIAFLPFTVGIVVAAQVASALASRVDPRWIAGSGGALSVLAMWGYSQMDVGAGYATDLLPWVVVQAVGMGLLFVPLTLTAVSRVDPGDAGVGSAVLNTVQQVGGAMGIAVLGTVFANGISERTAELAAAGAPPGPAAALEAQAFGTSEAFGVALWMMAAVTAVILVGLSIGHEELATDVTPGAAPVPGGPPEVPLQTDAPREDGAGPSTQARVAGTRE